MDTFDEKYFYARMEPDIDEISTENLLKTAIGTKSFSAVKYFLDTQDEKFDINEQLDGFYCTGYFPCHRTYYILDAIRMDSREIVELLYSYGARLDVYEYTLDRRLLGVLEWAIKEATDIKIVSFLAQFDEFRCEALRFIMKRGKVEDLHGLKLQPYLHQIRSYERNTEMSRYYWDIRRSYVNFIKYYLGKLTNSQFHLAKLILEFMGIELTPRDF